MKKAFQTRQKILRVFVEGKVFKVGEIVRLVSMSRPTVHHYLNQLVAEGILIKHDNGPHSTYEIAKEEYIPANAPRTPYFEHDFSYSDVKILEETFLKYTPDGNMLAGVQGFITWCRQRNIDEYQAFENYKAIYNTLEKLYTSCGLLDATEEFSKHVDEVSLTQLFYTGQYKWNEFGRSKLAEQGFYGKQTQNYELLRAVCSQAVPRIHCLIRKFKIDALAFTPPSLKREVQIMDVLDELLKDIPLPRIQLFKDFPGDVITPQKSLRKRADRVVNARNTIYVYDKTVSTYNHILLLDDFVGSGATLNETAKKLLQSGAKKIIGCALVGNLDLSYEVISEM